ALGSALEVTPDPAQRAHLLERIGRLQTFHSDWEAGFANLAGAVDAYTALGDRIGVMRATGVLIGENMAATRIADAEKLTAGIATDLEALVGKALEHGAEKDREAGEAAALLAETMARLNFRRQRYQDSVAWADRALALAEPLRLDETITMALVTKGTSMAFTGQLRQGIALLEGAALDATAHRQNLAALRALNNLASFTSGIDPRGSLERTKLGVATVRRLGLRSFDGYHSGNAVGAGESLGEWIWVHDAVSTMLEGDQDRVETEWLEFSRDYFSIWTGSPDVARIERLMTMARQDADLQSVRNLSSTLAKIAFAAGEPGRALGIVEPFLRETSLGNAWDFEWFGRYALLAGKADVGRRILEHVGAGPGGAIDHHLDALRAGLAALDGRRDDAVALYRSALAGYRSFGMRFSLANTIIDMAKLLGADDPAVRSVIDESRGILEELGAVTLLAHLNALGPDAGAARQRQSMVTTSIGSDRPLSSSLRTPEER
ncbi:MAG: hypothetical protein QOI92_1766, partial [Chloroflexota bacterium]|nr:hypothetical protein [Chloroflexota bacterium]